MSHYCTNQIVFFDSACLKFALHFKVQIVWCSRVEFKTHLLGRHDISLIRVVFDEV